MTKPLYNVGDYIRLKNETSSFWSIEIVGTENECYYCYEPNRKSGVSMWRCFENPKTKEVRSIEYTCWIVFDVAHNMYELDQNLKLKILINSLNREHNEYHKL
jgi:hypothetical protein